MYNIIPMKNYGFLREKIETLLYRLGVRHITAHNGYVLRTAPPFLARVPGAPPEGEPFCAAFARAYLRPCDTVADVGAGGGALSLIAAGHVRAAGRVLAVEPHPRAFMYLQENIALNGFQNIFALNAAVSEQKGVVRVTDYRDCRYNRVCEAGGKVVKADTLDGTLWRLEKGISLLCLDLNGHEARALAVSAETLAHTKVLCFELCRPALALYGDDVKGVLAPLEKAGLQLCRFDGKALLPLSAPEEPPDGYYYAARDVDACNSRLAEKL